MKKLNQQEIQSVLTGALEFDPTGLLVEAKLDFEQRCLYSIAMSLKAISDRLERAADTGRL